MLMKTLGFLEFYEKISIFISCECVVHITSHLETGLKWLLTVSFY